MACLPGDTSNGPLAEIRFARIPGGHECAGRGVRMTIAMSYLRPANIQDGTDAGRRQIRL